MHIKTIITPVRAVWLNREDQEAGLGIGLAIVS